jgi:hypothetical protein
MVKTRSMVKDESAKLYVVLSGTQAKPNPTISNQNLIPDYQYIREFEVKTVVTVCIRLGNTFHSRDESLGGPYNRYLFLEL